MKQDSLSYVRERVDETGRSPERLQLEQSWLDAVSYYAGVQDYVRDRWGRVRPRRRAEQEVTYSHNEIKPLVMRSIARMLARHVEYEVLPATASIEDEIAADVARRYFDWRLQSSEHRQARLALEMWKCVTGLAFTKSWWDVRAGEPARIYYRKKFELVGGSRTANRQPAVDLDDEERRNLEKQGLYQDIAPGAPVFDVLSPFEVQWDMRARDRGIDKCEWVCHRMLMRIDQAQARWPKKASKIAKSKRFDFRAGGLYYLEMISRMVGGLEGFLSPVHADYETNNLVVVEEHWEIPLPKNDMKGRLIQIVGDVVVEDGDNPLAPAGIEHPFTEWRWFPSPGTLAGTGIPHETMQAQRAYNEDSSRIREQIRLASNPRTVVEKSSGVKPEDFSVRPNNMIEVNRGSRFPVQLEPPRVSQDLRFELEARRMEMSRAAGVSEIDTGQAPGQVRGSIGIQGLLQASQEIMDPVIECQHISMQRLGRLELRLAGTFMEEQRLIRIAGQDGTRDAFFFRGADLRSNYDLRVTSEPGERDDKISRVTDLDFMLERAVLNPMDPADKAFIMRTLRYRGTRDDFSEELREETNERVLIQRIVQDPTLAPEINPWDIPEARLRAINSFRRRMDTWATIDEAARQTINARAGAFEARIVEAQAAMMQMQATLAGTPGEKGTASQAKNTPPTRQAV